MRVMKNKATLLSLAVAGLFAASAAQAQVILNTGAGAPTYASEIVVPFAVTAANAPAAQIPLGFGVSANQTIWIRYNLTNATFGGVVAAGALTDFTTAGNIMAANVIVAQGGTAGSSYVVFQVTATAAGIPFTDVIQFLPGVAINMLNSSGGSTGTIGNAGMTYSLHGSQASAAPTSNATDSQRITITGPINYLVAAQAYNFGYATAPTETIASINAFTKFCSGAVAGTPGTAGCAAANSDVDAMIAVVNAFGINTATTRLDRTGTALANTTAGLTVLTASNGLTVTGTDLNAATAAYAWDSAAPAVCGAGTSIAGTFNAVAPGRTAASIAFGLNPLATAVRSICVTVNGTGALTAQTFNGSMVPVTSAAASYTLASIATPGVGTWVRDGTEFQSPWFNLASTSYLSRFFLTNTGATTVPCTITLLTETGSTVTAGATTSVTIPANGVATVASTDIAQNTAAVPTASRAAARFVCAGPTTNLQAAYVITATSSGAVSVTDLIRPGTN